MKTERRAAFFRKPVMIPLKAGGVTGAAGFLAGSRNARTAVRRMSGAICVRLQPVNVARECRRAQPCCQWLSYILYKTYNLVAFAGLQTAFCGEIAGYELRASQYHGRSSSRHGIR